MSDAFARRRDPSWSLPDVTTTIRKDYFHHGLHNIFIRQLNFVEQKLVYGLCQSDAVRSGVRSTYYPIQCCAITFFCAPMLYLLANQVKVTTDEYLYDQTIAHGWFPSSTYRARNYDAINSIKLRFPKNNMKTTQTGTTVMKEAGLFSVAECDVKSDQTSSCNLPARIKAISPNSALQHHSTQQESK